MLNFILSSINRISAQTCNLRQVQNISLLVCQYANETPFVSFVQAYQYAIDCFVFFSDPAIRVQLTDFTWTVMKRFLWFIRHYVCPIFFKTSLSQIESAQVIFEQTLTRTSRNQKGKVAQGVACQRQEKRDQREAHPFGDFPSGIL